jgi:hypothetical protein
MLRELYDMSALNDADAIRRQFRRMLPEYEPTQRHLTPVAAGAPYADGF